MAEPLLTTSIFAVGELATGVGKALNKLYNASDEILALGNEIADLQALTKQLGCICEEEWPRGQQEYVKRATKILDSAIRSRLERLQRLLNKYFRQPSVKGLQRPTWVLLESKINRERNGFRIAKQQLLEVFQLLNSSTTRHIRFQVDHLAIGIDYERQTLANNQTQIVGRLDRAANNQAEILNRLTQIESLFRRVPPTPAESILEVVRRDIDHVRGIATGNQVELFNQFASLRQSIHKELRNNTLRHQRAQSSSNWNGNSEVDQIFASRSNSIPGEQWNESSTLSCILEGRQSGCAQFCGCCCHQKQTRLSTPALTDRLIGQLLAGLTIRPWIGKRCDESQCKRSGRCVLRLRYTFPSWFLAYCVTILASASTTYGPELIIRMPRVRSHTEDIFEKVALGDVQFVKLAFTNNKASIHDVEDIGGHTLLHRALSGKRPGMAKFLLSQGADINAVNHKNNSCGDIFWTIVLSNGLSEHEYESLITAFADASYIEEGEFSDIHRIIFKQSRVRLEDKLQDSRKMINQQDAYGRTPLAWAAARGDLELVEILLKYKADPNIVEKGGWGPLHNSMLTTRSDVSLCLLEAGADPNIASRVFRDTPLQIACRARELVCHIPGLLKYNADASISSKLYDTALEFAASRDYHETVNLLISPTPRERHTKAVVSAIQFQALKSLAKLLEHDADCTGIDSNGRSVLHHAAIHASIETLVMLAKHNLNVPHDTLDNNGETAMDLVTEKITNDMWRDAWNQLLAPEIPHNSIADYNSSEDEEDIFLDAEEYH